MPVVMRGARRRPRMDAAAVLTWAAVAAFCVLPHAPRADITSYARVLDDATLRVGRHHVRLHGIYVPPTGRTCRSNVNPVRCATRAALALDFKIQGFVRCEERVRYRDGSVSAVCYNDDVDLGAYLIERGWAVAAPGAPFHYQVLEDIAKQRNMGVWGFHADQVEPG